MTVEVTGLSLYTHHGVSEAEREVGQRLILDLRFDAGACDATVTDRVEDTVDYARVCDVVALAAQRRSYKTLEGSARRSPTSLLDDFDAGEVWVKATKPEPPIALPVEIGLGRGLAHAGRGVSRRTRRRRRGVTGYLGLGSNVGDRRAHLQAAVDALPGHGVSVARPPRPPTRPSRSGSCSTSPRSSTPACGSRRRSAPRSLLDACKAVERKEGRRSGGVRHGPREIDVDLLLLGDLRARERAAELPHARSRSAASS